MENKVMIASIKRIWRDEWIKGKNTFAGDKVLYKFLKLL